MKISRLVNALLLIFTIIAIGYITPGLGRRISPSPVYVVVRGTDNGIYYGSDLAGTWHGWTRLPGATLDAPAAAICFGLLYIVVRGTDNGIYYGYVPFVNMTFDSPLNRHGWTRLAGATPSAPGLTAAYTTPVGSAPNYNEFCHLFLTVRGTDNQIYYTTNSQIEGYALGTWLKVPTGATIDSPSMVATVQGGVLSQLHLAVLGTNGKLYATTTSTLQQLIIWGPWVQMSGASPNGPELATFSSLDSSPPPVNMTVRGMDGRIYWSEWTGTQWWVWTVIPTGATSLTPSIVITRDGVVYVAVRGTGSTGAIYYCYLASPVSSWSSWSSIPGATPSQPAIASEAIP